MRTKTLLLTAALAAAGVISSQADTMSVNAVGYINKQVHLNWNLIGAPFQPTSASDTTFYNLDVLMPADQMKNNMAAYRIGDASHNITSQIAFFDPADGFWDFGGNPAWAVVPGNGILIFSAPNGANPQPFTFTTVGQVPESPNRDTSQPIPRISIPQGYSVQSSIVPQTGGIQSVLGFNPQADCNVVLYDSNFNYTKLTPPYFYAVADGFWDGPVGYPADANGDPILGYAEACVLFSSAVQNWNRTFAVQ
jgi:hypothetical protein